MKATVSLMVLALAGVAVTASAQGTGETGSVTGRVTDERGQALGGAEVLVVGRGDLATRSTANGSYVLDGVPAGPHTLRARAIGFKSQTAEVMVAAGQRASRDFTLEADPLDLEAVVVTGTQTPRVKLDASVAITTLSPAEITQAAPRSTTEMLRYVPGFTRVESSGGEVNQNISMRGILGVEYVMFMEDGLPVFPTMHTFFMNADNLFRPDENIERVEVVRGGSSALFGSNTPGAIINFINKSGSSHMAGTLKASAATAGLARYDFNVNGPLGQDWTFNTGGFYRYDHGVRDPGFAGIRGGQFKGSVTRRLDNGYMRFSTKVIDDRNQFILPLPFQNPADPEYVPGFSDYGAMNTNEGLHISVPLPTGEELSLPLDDGLRTKASWLTADVAFDFAGGWRIQNTAQIMQNEQGWNAILPFDLVPADTFAANEILRLARQGIVDSTIATYDLFYTNHTDGFGDPAPFTTANGLLAPSGEWHVEKPLTAFQNQLSLRKTAGENNFSFGVYFANYTQGNRWFFTDILTDVRDNPRFVDLVIYSGPDTIAVTKNGFRQYLSNYANGSGQTTIVSGVAGAELRLSDRLRADIGLRYESNTFVQTSENTATNDLDGDPNTPYDQEPWGTGSFRHLSRTMGDWAGSLGLNVSLNDQTAVYVLGARAYKMPALDDFLFAAAQEQVELYEPRRTKSFEAGVKYASRAWGVTVNGFYTDLRNIVEQGAVTDTLTGRITWRVRPRPGNYAVGAELELSAVPTLGLALIGNATVLKANVDTLGGIEQSGVPRLIGNLAARYTVGKATVVGDFHYVGKRFAGDFNQTPRNELPSYLYANFGVHISQLGQGLGLGVDLLNAFQSKGLEEGNPRLTGASGTRFLARPLLPRRLMVSLRYEF
ncbi:MAG: TonB-dependent receptor [Gemmatimonadales bacterium]|nr:TonB-dependent receptor [Gemmatimonadales bacterium]